MVPLRALRLDWKRYAAKADLSVPRVRLTVLLRDPTKARSKRIRSGPLMTPESADCLVLSSVRPTESYSDLMKVQSLVVNLEVPKETSSKAPKESYLVVMTVMLMAAWMADH